MQKVINTKELQMNKKGDVYADIQGMDGSTDVERSKQNYVLLTLFDIIKYLSTEKERRHIKLNGFGFSHIMKRKKKNLSLNRQDK